MKLKTNSQTQKETKKKKKIGTYLLYAFFALLFVAGLLMTFNKPIRNQHIAKVTTEHQVNNIPKETLEENNQKEATFDFEAVEPISTEAIIQEAAAAVTNQTVSAPKSTDRSFLTIAGIAIPELGMNLPIYKGLDSYSLLYGAGTMKADQEPGKGNYALASHHMFGYGENLLFSPLSRAREGMTIYVTDKNKVYTYHISSIQVVDPSSVYVIEDEPGKTEITLVTCNDYAATKRIIVKGDYLGEHPYETVDQAVVDAFSVPQTQAWW